MKKIKTLITMISPTPEIRRMLEEIETRAEICFLKEGEDIGENLRGVEVLYGSIPENDFHKADKVRWIQTNSTGVDHMMYPAFKEGPVILTNAGPAITDIVAEHALAMLFALARNLHLQRDHMRERKWEIECGVEIGGLPLGILGFGRIGSAVARRAAAFVREIHVLDMRPLGKLENVARTYGIDGLVEMLANCKAIICAIPLTEKTRNLIGDKEISMMPDRSYMVNVSRGGIVNEEALVRALRSGKLAGAGLDVTETEPYPAEGPLWSEPSLLLTPHSSGYCERLEERKMACFIRNFKAYLENGQIPGSVDKTKGW